MSGELNVTHNGGVTGTSGPQYSDVNIELQTSSNHVPGISFHRGGYSATTLYEYDGELYVNAWTVRNQTGKLVSFGNDGSGSGLDADLLDGQQGSYYAPASTAVTLAGTQTITGTKTFESTSQAPLRLHVTNSSASWDAMTFQGTDEWGDGQNYGVLGGDGTEGIMLRRPHIVWNSNHNAADIRLGRSGGTSSGKYVVMGIGASNQGFLAMESTRVLTFESDYSVRIPAGNFTVDGTISSGAITSSGAVEGASLHTNCLLYTSDAADE